MSDGTATFDRGMRPPTLAHEAGRYSHRTAFAGLSRSARDGLASFDFAGIAILVALLPIQ